MPDDTAMDDGTPSRALMVRDAPADSRRPGPPAGPRPLAAFVAQHFACEARLTPFRDRRRAAPGEGAATYEGADRTVTAAPARFERRL